MNKGLEALEHLNKNIIVAEDIDEDFNIIEKELKAFEIIKKYNIRPSDFHYCTTYNIYLLNMSFAEKDEIMSEEEYDIAKEVLVCHQLNVV